MKAKLFGKVIGCCADIKHKDDIVWYERFIPNTLGLEILRCYSSECAHGRMGINAVEGTVQFDNGDPLPIEIFGINI